MSQAACASETRIRSRKACDACSIRKIKCDERLPRCKSCRLLDVACTFDRPTRRRGPTSRHVDSWIRQRRGNGPIEPDAPPSTASVADLPSEPMPRTGLQLPPQTGDNSASESHSRFLTTSAAFGDSLEDSMTAESICDIETLKLLLDDYFTYIHPVIPLPHEPTFRAAFARRDDRIDSSFLGQIAAMIEVLASSFPRSPMQLLTSPEARRRYPNVEALIGKCHQVLNHARGTDFMDRDPNLTDALCSYLAGLSAGYTFRMARQRRYLGECILVLRTLGLHKPEDPTQPDAKSINHIHQQSGRRLFWLCFVGTMSMRQLGGYDSDVLIPPTAYKETLPPLPLEVDDEFIYPSTILRQPIGVTPRVAGFNINVRIFRAFHRLTALEMLFGEVTVYDWKRQCRSIRSALQEVKEITSLVPRELQLRLSSNYSEWSFEPDDAIGGMACLVKAAAFDARTQCTLPVTSTQSKRIIQYEIQKANIYATQLATRSYLVEKFWNLYEIHDRDAASPAMSTNGLSALFSPLSTGVAADRDATGTNQDPVEIVDHLMAVEREAIVRDMALLLQNINRVNMEPNGISMCNKIRQVASTLLSQDRCRMSRMPHLDPETVNSYLYGFCDILARLERVGSGTADGSESIGALHMNIANEINAGQRGDTTAQELEDENLVHWASLQDHQERFVRMSGFLDNL